MKISNLFILSFIFLSSCNYFGFGLPKPIVTTKRDIFLQNCLRASFLLSDNKNANKQYSEFESKFRLCVIYSARISNDPSDCTSNDILKILEENRILREIGCGSNQPQE